MGGHRSRCCFSTPASSTSGDSCQVVLTAFETLVTVSQPLCYASVPNAPKCIQTSRLQQGEVCSHCSSSTSDTHPTAIGNFGPCYSLRLFRPACWHSQQTAIANRYCHWPLKPISHSTGPRGFDQASNIQPNNSQQVIKLRALCLFGASPAW